MLSIELSEKASHDATMIAQQKIYEQLWENNHKNVRVGTGGLRGEGGDQKEKEDVSGAG